MEKSRYPHVIETGGVVLTLTPDEVYVEFKEDVPPETIEEFVAEYQLQLVREEPSLLPRPGFNEAFTDRCWVRLPEEAHIDEYIERLLGDDQVRLASPVYHRADLLPMKTGFAFSDYLLVRFRQDSSDRSTSALIKKLGTVDATGEPNLLGDGLRRIRIREPKSQNALETAEQFEQSQLVEYAGPDWAQLHSAISATIPNDTYWGNQWNMTKIGAPDGWDLTLGANAVVIAVLDTGCDLNHEDLSAKYVPVADRRDSVAGTNAPEDDWGHGTCCAGIAAAESNNIHGVSGVAWDCRIMPIRMMKNAYINFESRVVDAINWAWIHGAHVISMSFKWDGPHANADTAIANAHAANIVLVAATGNDAPTQPVNTIRYPADHAQVMAVGASDQLDHRCVWSASQASQFGPGLDVVAPGIDTWTTDRTGTTAGYNPHPFTGVVRGDAAGNYFNDFGGTSGATPHVAGLAALLRSLYPTLTNDEIRSIIERTAEKVGGYAYAHDPAHPSGTWNNEMGYGRINVLRALEAARPLPSFQYAVKFVCGRSRGEAVAPGIYFTAINVHNPTYEDVRFRKKVAVALPGEQPGPVSKFFEAKLGPDQAFEIDCRDIRQHADTNASFLKGFVVIETDVELDVVAVYTTAREVQVEAIHERVAPRKLCEQPVRQPDLVPVPDPRPGFGFCKLVEEGPDKGKLVVTVKNQGSADAPASVARVIFAPGGPFDLPTPPIPAGGSIDLPPLRMPGRCWNPDCNFTIVVDANNDVVESNEANNMGSGICIG